MTWLLFIMQIHFYFQGLFMTKKELGNKAAEYFAAPTANQESKSAEEKPRKTKPPKVIMLLVDALREDFVEFDRDGGESIEKTLESSSLRKKAHTYLDIDKSVYQGHKMQIFNNLVIDEPEHAVLLPMEAELPTVTTVRIKAIMTGALSSFFETKEDFANERIVEDSVLHQVKNYIGDLPQKEQEEIREKYKDQDVNLRKDKRLIFAGDHIWLDMFKHLFDLERHYPSYNVRDLETNDLNVHQDILTVLSNDISARYETYNN